MLRVLSCVWLCTHGLLACQTSLSKEFSRRGVVECRYSIFQDIFLTQGLNLCLVASPASAVGFFTSSITGSGLGHRYLWVPLDLTEKHLCARLTTLWVRLTGSDAYLCKRELPVGFLEPHFMYMNSQTRITRYQGTIQKLDTYMHMKKHTHRTHIHLPEHISSTCIYANLFASIHRPTHIHQECPLGTRGHSKRTRVCDIFSPLFSYSENRRKARSIYISKNRWSWRPTGLGIWALWSQAR